RTCPEAAAAASRPTAGLCATFPDIRRRFAGRGFGAAAMSRSRAPMGFPQRFDALTTVVHRLPDAALIRAKCPPMRLVNEGFSARQAAWQASRAVPILRVHS